METTYALNENKSLQEIKRPPRIGFIKTFAGATPPEGTLLCDGSAVSRDTYSELFAAIGTTWGSGDGANTFNLPDLRDVWILCAGTEHEAGDSVVEGLPNITGLYGMNNILTNQTVAPTVEGAIYAATIADGGTHAFTPGYCNLGGFRFSAALSNSIYGASQHVTPASVAVLPCIVFE